MIQTRFLDKFKNADMDKLDEILEASKFTVLDM